MANAGGIGILSDKHQNIVQENLHEAEKVDFCLLGEYNQSIIALDDRLIVLKSGFMAGATFGSRVTSIYYREITSIEVNTGVLMGVLEICTPSYEGTRTKSYWNLDRDRDPWKLSNCIPISKTYLKEYQPYLDKLRAKIVEAKRPTVMSGSKTDLSTELQKLSELNKQGILTDEEFQQAKKKLLGF
jgi:hypothetical protein